MVSLEEIQTIKNQENHGSGSDREICHKDVSNKCRLCGTRRKCSAHNDWLQYVSTERVQEKTQQRMFEHPLSLMQEAWSKSM